MPRPPAYGAPPRVVWQVMQLPARARYSPRATCSGVPSAGAASAAIGASPRTFSQATPAAKADQQHDHEGDPAAQHGVPQRGTLPQRCGSGAGKESAALAGTGTGRLDSQAATALTSSGDSRLATSAMQSGACARRWPLRPGAELALQVVARQAEQPGDGRRHAGQRAAVASGAGGEFARRVALQREALAALQRGGVGARPAAVPDRAGRARRNGRRSRAGSRRRGGRPGRPSARSGACPRGS